MIMVEDSAGHFPFLEVNDFGPIKNAKIELRPLTVFVGPSNSGKSYLAVLIYALHRALSQMLRSYPNLQVIPGLEREMSNSQNDFVDQIISEIQSEDSQKAIELQNNTLTGFLDDIKNRSSGIIHEITRCHGFVDPIDLRRKFGGSNSEIRLALPANTTQSSIARMFSERQQGCQVEILGSNQVLIEPLVCWDLYKRWSNAECGLAHGTGARSEIGEKVSTTAFETLMEAMLAPAYYLPADRTGVMNFHSLVVSGLLGSVVPRGSMSKANDPMLSGVLSDFLRELLGIEKYGQRRRNIGSSDHDRKDVQEIAARIEFSVLDGSIVVEETALINYPKFYYKPRGWRSLLPLLNASSMVTDLAPIVMYLRNLVEVGDTIVIEELESHLHPSMQIKLTELVAELVAAGVKVVITTHSEWVLSCLNNIVLRGRRLDHERRSGGGSVTGKTDVSLQEADVGVWAFRKSGVRSGSVVEELGFVDTDGYITEFEDEMISLHNEWAREASNWR